MGKEIAVLGDTSTHGGTIVTTNQDGTLIVTVGGGFAPPFSTGGMFGSFMWGELLGTPGTAVGLLPAIEGALHSCPIPGHGVTAITAIAYKTFHNSKPILTILATAGCGARITPPDRRVYIE